MTQIIIISSSVGGVFVLVLCTILLRKLCKRHTLSMRTPRLAKSRRHANHLLGDPIRLPPPESRAGQQIRRRRLARD